MNVSPDPEAASVKNVHTAVNAVYANLDVNVVRVIILHVPAENAVDVVRAPFRVAEDPAYVATVLVVMDWFVKTAAVAKVDYQTVQKDHAAAVMDPDPVVPAHAPA